MQTAEAYWDQLLEIDQARLPADSLPLALTLNNVGYIKLHVGKPSLAGQLLRRALHIRRNRLPLLHPDIARTLYGELALARG